MKNNKLIKFLKPNLPQNLINININLEDLINNFEKYFNFKNKKMNLHFGVSASFLFSQILENNKSHKTDVLLPVIICEKMYKAAKECGYDVIFFDLNKNFEISIDVIEKNITKKTFAVVIPHFFGIYNKNISKLIKLLKEKNIILIEDYAQSIGLEKVNKNHKFYGDYILYSFGYGKTLFCPAGGLVLSKSNLNRFKKVEIMDNDYDLKKLTKYTEVNFRLKFKYFFIKIFGFNIFNLLKSIFNKLNKNYEKFEKNNSVSSDSIKITSYNFSMLQSIIDKQILNGKKIINTLKLKDLDASILNYNSSVYSKILLIFNNKKSLYKIKKKLIYNNIEFEESYKILDIINRNNYKNSQVLVNRSISIPNRWNLENNEIKLILEIFR